MKLLACVLALLIPGMALAGMIFLQAPPSGNTNLVPVQQLPYTYVLGFDPNTGNIHGVCGYRMKASSGRSGNHPVEDFCSWNLQGHSLGLNGQAFPLPAIPYGPVNYYPDPVTGGLVPVFVVAVDAQGDVIGVLDEFPRVAVLITP